MKSIATLVIMIGIFVVIFSSVTKGIILILAGLAIMMFRE